MVEDSDRTTEEWGPVTEPLPGGRRGRGTEGTSPLGKEN